MNLNDIHCILKDNGLVTDTVINNGDIHRCYTSTTKKSGKKNGWYVCHSFFIGNNEVLTCLYGDWALSDKPLGIYKSWEHDTSYNLNSSDISAIKAAQAAQAEKLAAEKDKRHKEAAMKATEKWEGLADTGDSDYLTDKGVKPYGIKYGHDAIEGGYITIPIRSHGGGIKGLQLIYDKPLSYDPTRTKTFTSGVEKKGHFHAIGELSPMHPLCFVEGYATGASVHEATGYPVIVCFDAGNIKPVVESFRAKYPAQDFVICADNDQWKQSNTGIDKASDTAKAYGCYLAIPDFTELDVSTKPTDFNDLYLLAGLGMVKTIIDSAAGLQKSIRQATDEEIEQHDFDYEPEPRPTFDNPALPIKHLSAICDYINAPIYYYSPKATQHAAIAVICQIVSRRFISDGGDKCSLMVGNVGASVSQLADINNSIEALFCEIGMDDDVRLDRMTHIDLTAHYTNEASSGKLLYMPPDLGAMTRGSQKQTSMAVDGFLSEIMQFHDKERHTFRTVKARVKVENPIINLLANFDDTDLFTFGKTSNQDGLFNLFLTQQNDSKDFIFNEKKHKPLTNTDGFTGLRDHINKLMGKSESLLPAVKTPNANAAVVIPWAINPAGYAEKLKEAAGSGKLAGRVMRQFVNLTTAVAAWNGDSAVTESLSGVCCDYVCHRVSEMQEALKKRKSDDVAPDVMSRVLSVIHRAGVDGISESRLIQSCSGFKKMADAEREELIRHLLKVKEISDTLSDGNNKGKGGRKGRKFFIR